MESKVGIDKLKEAVILGIDVGTTVVSVVSDGIQPIQDLMALLNSGMQVQRMVKENGKEIKEQFLDVDKEEGAELNRIVAEKYKVGSAKAQRMVEAGINILWGVIYFVDQMNEPGDAPAKA